MRKAEDSEWVRRGGLGLRAGLGSRDGGLEVGEGLDLSSGMVTRRGICRDSLLVRAREEDELHLGRNFQPRGSCPVMTDVCTGGGEEQDEEEEVDERGVGDLQIPMGGQE